METHMYSVVYTGADRVVGDELERLAELVGVDFTRARAAGVLMFDDADEAGVVHGHYHEMFSPYFPRGRVRVNPQEESADILELMAAVGMTVRGKVLGVIGAHGGAGTSTLAAWIARILAEEEECALVDVNPASAGIDHLLAIDAEPGQRWADLTGSGAILAGRLAGVLPQWHGVKVVSADDRGGVPGAHEGIAVVGALAQVHAWTVLDLPASASLASSPDRGLIDWCDALVLVTRPDAVSLAHAAARRVVLGKAPIVVAMTVGSKSEAAHIAEAIGATQVLPMRAVRNPRGDVDHGVAPGDRKKSGVDRDVRVVVERVREALS
ncbi:hypothetical protein [Trueperella pecoris]|uniref:hypothetical protein n=1 Tax=Trueperella pecoris TaxID=2733571 RepID=UPI00186BA51D|nr:hypothetical protein [Trueperella pecoris]QOQ37996.1 hypothetical protein HLG82_00070 [Trueperella pecoris]QTG75401.1 hypothetical protein J4179_09380 [Trueperella pecoris]